jgi:hypothetical protein
MILVSLSPVARRGAPLKQLFALLVGWLARALSHGARRALAWKRWKIRSIRGAPRAALRRWLCPTIGRILCSGTCMSHESLYHGVESVAECATDDNNPSPRAAARLSRELGHKRLSLARRIARSSSRCQDGLKLVGAT